MGYDVFVQFTETETRFDGAIIENKLSNLLKEALLEVETESITVRVNKVLSVINDYENEVLSPEISDLIEVDIPFVNGILPKSQHPIVIFDTPGSNSASNARHLQVLKEAMANMTNGLPVFLSTPDSLDSTDNENLYHIIRDSIWAVQELYRPGNSKEEFYNILQRNMQPIYDSARRQGYEIWNY